LCGVDGGRINGNFEEEPHEEQSDSDKKRNLGPKQLVKHRKAPFVSRLLHF